MRISLPKLAVLLVVFGCNSAEPEQGAKDVNHVSFRLTFSDADLAAKATKEALEADIKKQLSDEFELESEQPDRPGLMKSGKDFL